MCTAILQILNDIRHGLLDVGSLVHKKFPAAVLRIFGKENSAIDLWGQIETLGLLCVATDCPSGGPAELIRDHENGLLVQNDNPKKLADAIIKFLENPGLADSLGENARKITEKYSVEEICTEWRTYICRVVNGED